MMMKSRYRLSMDNLLDISRETSCQGALVSDRFGRVLASPGHSALHGRFEAQALGPGLAVSIMDLYTERGAELFVEHNEDSAAFVLCVSGASRMASADNLKGRRGVEVKAGYTVVGACRAEKSRLTLAAGVSHRVVKVKLDRAHLPRLLDQWETSIPCGLRPILDEGGPASATVQKSLSPSLECLAYQMIRCPLAGAARRLFLEGKALEILAWELDYFSGEVLTHTTLSPADKDRLYQARSILEVEFAEPPTLCELAHRVSLNDFKLKQGFRRLFNTSVFEYVRRLRMEKAAALLATGESSVTEVAVAVGYSALGHFSAAFKKEFGVLPSRYGSGLKHTRHVFRANDHEPGQ